MLKFEQRFIGIGGWPIAIIDDFHEDPMTLIKMAGNISNFEEYKNDFYPGVKQVLSNNAYATKLDSYADVLLSSFGQIGYLQNSAYAIANIELSELLAIQRIPHYDSINRLEYALVHYLCAPKWGGTAFYRHRSTKIERIEGQNERDFQQTLGREATTHGLPVAGYINGDTDLFEQIGVVDARFNRAVIYPASLLHSGAIAPQQVQRMCSINEMRLTITSHFQVTLCETVNN